MQMRKKGEKLSRIHLFPFFAFFRICMCGFSPFYIIKATFFCIFSFFRPFPESFRPGFFLGRAQNTIHNSTINICSNFSLFFASACVIFRFFTLYKQCFCIFRFFRLFPKSFRPVFSCDVHRTQYTAVLATQILEL